MLWESAQGRADVVKEGEGGQQTWRCAREKPRDAQVQKAVQADARKRVRTDQKKQKGFKSAPERHGCKRLDRGSGAMLS